MYIWGLSQNLKKNLFNKSYFNPRSSQCKIFLLANGRTFKKELKCQNPKPTRDRPRPLVYFTYTTCISIEPDLSEEQKGLDFSQILVITTLAHSAEQVKGKHHLQPSSLATEALLWISLAECVFVASALGFLVMMYGGFTGGKSNHWKVMPLVFWETIPLSCGSGFLLNSPRGLTITPTCIPCVQETGNTFSSNIAHTKIPIHCMLLSTYKEVLHFILFHCTALHSTFPNS